jgi:glycosyltransferase involved in cell wall biosynthesis
VKIAFCLEYPIGQAGGVSVLVLTLIREFAANHEITLISPDTPQTLVEAKLGDTVRNYISWSPQSASPETARALSREIARCGVQIAHFHFGGNFGWSNRYPSHCPIPFLSQLGVPVVTTIHMAVGLLHGYCGPQKPLLFKLMLLPAAWINKMRVLKHVQREITVSQQDLERLRAWYWPAAKKFIHIYHSRIRTPAKPAIAVREKIILGVGHIARRKGQLVLAEAFLRLAAKYPDWKLLLAGHAAETDTYIEVQKFAARVPRQIELLGQRDDTAQLMQRAAIYVQPSFHEGLPLSLQEALYYHCACVATRIPGNIELVDHERNGFLVPAGDATAMANALDQLISNEALRDKFADAGHISVLAKKMTVTDMTEKHRALYDDILKSR